MRERWIVNPSTGAVVKMKIGRAADTKSPMYIDRSESIKPPRPLHIAPQDRDRKDPFNVLWASDDDV